MPAKISSTSNPPRLGEMAASLAILATGVAILLLATLHVLSPECSPSWRAIGEYAFGRYPSVLSLMFFVLGYRLVGVGYRLSDGSRAAECRSGP